MISLVTYILISKMFNNLKKYMSHDRILDKSDPFIALLVKENEDFIATESFLMKIQMLFIFNNYLNIFISFERFNEEFLRKRLENKDDLEQIRLYSQNVITPFCML